MNVFKDRLLFIFSSKNEHNLWSKPHFAPILYIIMMILYGLICLFIGKLFCSFELEWMDTKFRNELCINSLVAGFILSLFFFVIYIIIKFIRYYIEELIQEIQQSFQPHAEVVQRKGL